MTLGPRLAALFLTAFAAASILAAACGSDDSDPSTATDVSSSVVGTAPGSDSPASGTVAPSADVIDLAETPGLFTITLADYGDLQPGISALGVGDFNGDSLDDVLIGAPFADRPEVGGEDAGAAYVIFGGSDLQGSIDLAQDSPDLVVWGATAGDTMGFNVAAGDLNGDGVDDVIIAAPASHTLQNLRTDMGEVYVVFGGPDLGGAVDTRLLEQDFTLIPAEGFARLGTSIAVADLNGDGIDDLVAGAPWGGREPGTPPGGPRTTLGEVYVVFGGPGLTGQRSVARDEQDMLLSGARELDKFGESLAAADVDGDGAMDLVVGSPGYEAADGAVDTGAVFVFYSASLAQDRLSNADADIIVLGDEPGQGLSEVMRAADLDADGATEMLLSARQSDGLDGAVDAGRVYVIAGGRQTAADVTGAAVIYGADPASRLPQALLVADADADGSPDIVASAVLTTTSTTDVTGAVYVIFAGAGVTSKDLSSDLDGTLVIEAANDADGTGTGLAVSDLNGDGTPELLVAVAGRQESGAEEATRPVVHVIITK